MNKILPILAILVIIASCKPKKEDIIAKKWVAVSVESPELEHDMAQLRGFIDTVGTSTDANENEMLYGVRNMDSMRNHLRKDLDSAVEMQKTSIKNTWLDFGKDGKLAANFGTGVDTVKWYFDDEGNLMLDEMAQKGAGSKIRMEVVKLEDTILQLRFKENGFSSLATFIPE